MNRDIKGPLSQIRVSLVASLGAGQIIFLAGIGATENKVKSSTLVRIQGIEVARRFNSAYSMALKAIPLVQSPVLSGHTGSI